MPALYWSPGQLSHDVSTRTVLFLSIVWEFRKPFTSEQSGVIRGSFAFLLFFFFFSATVAPLTPLYFRQRALGLPVGSNTILSCLLVVELLFAGAALAAIARDAATQGSSGQRARVSNLQAGHGRRGESGSAMGRRTCSRWAGWLAGFVGEGVRRVRLEVNQRFDADADVDSFVRPAGCRGKRDCIEEGRECACVCV